MFVAMFIIDYFIDKSFKRDFQNLCALALFPSKSVHLPWALPLGVCSIMQKGNGKS